MKPEQREVARAGLSPRGRGGSLALPLHLPGRAAAAPQAPGRSDHRPPAARPARPGAGTRDGAGLTAASPPPHPRTLCPARGLAGAPGHRPDLHEGRARPRPERAALSAPEAVPGRAGGRGGGAAERAGLPACRGPGARAPRRELGASQPRRRDPEAEAEPRVEPSRCPRCPPAPGGGPGGWMGSGGAGRGRRWARSRAR